MRKCVHVVDSVLGLTSFQGCGGFSFQILSHLFSISFKAQSCYISIQLSGAI